MLPHGEIEIYTMMIVKRPGEGDLAFTTPRFTTPFESGALLAASLMQGAHDLLTHFNLHFGTEVTAILNGNLSKAKQEASTAKAAKEMGTASPDREIEIRGFPDRKPEGIATVKKFLDEAAAEKEKEKGYVQTSVSPEFTAKVKSMLTKRTPDPACHSEAVDETNRPHDDYLPRGVDTRQPKPPKEEEYVIHDRLWELIKQARPDAYKVLVKHGVEKCMLARDGTRFRMRFPTVHGTESPDFDRQRDGSDAVIVMDGTPEMLKYAGIPAHGRRLSGDGSDRIIWADLVLLGHRIGIKLGESRRCPVYLTRRGFKLTLRLPNDHLVECDIDELRSTDVVVWDNDYPTSFAELADCWRLFYEATHRLPTDLFLPKGVELFKPTTSANEGVMGMKIHRDAPEFKLA